jgi:hypothetical protein
MKIEIYFVILECKEFGEFTRKNNTLSGLLGQQPRVITTSICKHNSVPLVIGELFHQI